MMEGPGQYDTHEDRRQGALRRQSKDAMAARRCGDVSVGRGLRVRTPTMEKGIGEVESMESRKEHEGGHGSLGPSTYPGAQMPWLSYDRAGLKVRSCNLQA